MSPALARLSLCVIALSAGVLAGLRGPAFVAVLPLVAGVVLLRRRFRRGALVGLLLLSAGVGCLSGALRTTEGEELERIALKPVRCEFSGRVLEQIGGLGTLVALSTTLDSGATVSGTVAMQDVESLSSGTDVSGTGWLLPLTDSSFDEARFRLGARAILDPSDIESDAPDQWLFAFADRVRKRFSNSTLRFGEPGTLLLGLTIGDTSRSTPRTLDSFRRSGLSHLLAVSGSNVAIVLGALILLTRRSSARTRLVWCLAGIATFVTLVGPDASVLRAALMGGVTLFAVRWTRPVDPIHALAASLLLLVAARPTLVTSTALHLSVAATAGIVLWATKLAGRMRVLPRPVATVLAVTLSAQIAVAPILVFAFGQISLVAPITNLLAAPAVIVATLIGMAAALTAIASPALAQMLIALSVPFTRWLLWVAETGAALPWAVLELGS